MPNADVAPAAEAASRMRLDLGLVDERDDRRDAHAHRNASPGERLDRLEAPVRRCRTRLEDARQRRLERRDRDVDGHQVLRRHRRDQVEVALDARRLGDERERMRALGHDRDHRARDAQLPLDRLVGVGGRADVDRRRPIGTRRERRAQALGGVHLGDDLGLEVEPRRHAQVAVRRPGEAVDAAVLAAAIGIDREVEVDVGRVVAREDRLDALLDHRRLGSQALLGRGLLERAPAIVVALAAGARIAMLDRPHRAAPLDRPARRLLRTGRLVARDRSLSFGWRRQSR